MKILHTSDWHLGKKLYRMSRIKEQELFLAWLAKYIESEAIDVLLVSGDIFDVPTPPNEALKLYFNFLKKVSETSAVPIFIIGGNHDSSHFLEAPAPFLELNNIHVVGNLNELAKGNTTPYVHNLYIKDESVSICLFPYFRTHELFNLSKFWKIDTEQGLLPVIEKALGELANKAHGKKILMSHHLFGSYEEAGSEQGLNLSGIDSIPTKCLKDFDYVALGHIHKAQTVRKENPIVHYSGSPMAFRFSETSTKEISIIEIKDSQLTFSRVPVKEFDKLIRINCSKDEVEVHKEKIIAQWGNTSELEVYLEMKVKTTSPITSMAEKLRDEFQENNIHLLSFQAIVVNPDEEKEEHFLEKSLKTEELFEIYYKKKYPESEGVPRELKEDFNNLLESVRDMNEA